MSWKRGKKRKGKKRKASGDLLSRITEMLSLPDPGQLEDTVERFRGRTIGCFLCRRQLEVKLSKKMRPYLVCHDCCLQIFVRGDKGIERLAERTRADDD